MLVDGVLAVRDQGRRRYVDSFTTWGPHGGEWWKGKHPRIGFGSARTMCWHGRNCGGILPRKKWENRLKMEGTSHFEAFDGFIGGERDWSAMRSRCRLRTECRWQNCCVTGGESPRWSLGIWRNSVNGGTARNGTLNGEDSATMASAMCSWTQPLISLKAMEHGTDCEC